MGHREHGWSGFARPFLPDASVALGDRQRFAQLGNGAAARGGRQGLRSLEKRQGLQLRVAHQTNDLQGPLLIPRTEADRVETPGAGAPFARFAWTIQIADRLRRGLVMLRQLFRRATG